jgi:hypothetical protein
MPEGAIQRLKSSHRYIQTKITVLENSLSGVAIARGDVNCGIMLNIRVCRDLAVDAQAQIKPGVVARATHLPARQKSVRFSVGAEYPIVAPAEPLALCAQIRGLEAATSVTLIVRRDAPAAELA